MKKIVLVCLGLLVIPILTADPQWEGNALASSTQYFTSDALLGATNAFVPGTLVEVTDPATGKTVIVEIVSRIEEEGVFIILSASAGNSLGLAKDEVRRVIVKPQYSTSGAFMAEGPFSMDPDINPAANSATGFKASPGETDTAVADSNPSDLSLKNFLVQKAEPDQTVIPDTTADVVTPPDNTIKDQNLAIADIPDKNTTADKNPTTDKNTVSDKNTVVVDKTPVLKNVDGTNLSSPVSIKDPSYVLKTPEVNLTGQEMDQDRLLAAEVFHMANRLEEPEDLLPLISPDLQNSVKESISISQWLAPAEYKVRTPGLLDVPLIADLAAKEIPEDLEYYSVSASGFTGDSVAGAAPVLAEPVLSQKETAIASVPVIPGSASDQAVKAALAAPVLAASDRAVYGPYLHAIESDLTTALIAADVAPPDRPDVNPYISFVDPARSWALTQADLPVSAKPESSQIALIPSAQKSISYFMDPEIADSEKPQYSELVLASGKSHEADYLDPVLPVKDIPSATSDLATKPESGDFLADLIDPALKNPVDTKSNNVVDANATDVQDTTTKFTFDDFKNQDNQNNQNVSTQDKVPSYSGKTVTAISLVPAQMKPPSESKAAIVEGNVAMTYAGYTPEAVFDSKALAKKSLELGMPLVSSLSPKSDYVQVSIYADPVKAAAAVKLLSQTFPVVVLPTSLNDNALYKVMIGPLSKDESGVLLYILKASGFPDAFIRRVD